MKNQRFILLIMNCVKYKEKAEKQKNGWLKHLPEDLIYYHVIGNESLTSQYFFDEYDRILYVKTADDYNSLPYKVISAFEAINAEFNYQYIFKTDDDQHLTQPQFFGSLMNKLEMNETNYGGRLIVIQKEHISEYYNYHPELPNNILVKKTQYCNGRFYFVSKIAVENLLQKKSEFKSEYFEDYAVGYYMDENIKNSFMPINNSVFIDNI